MKKTESLLIISFATLLAVTGVVFITSGGLSNLSPLATYNPTLSTSSDYVLTLNSNNKIANDNSVLTNQGNKIYFATEGEVNKNLDSRWLTFVDDDSAVYNTTSISGMTSISFTMDYSYEMYLYFGYMEDDVIHYSNYCTLTKNGEKDGLSIYSYSFNETLPSYFKIKANNGDHYIGELTIGYSCSESGIVPTELSSFKCTYLSETDSYQIDGFKASRKNVQTLIIPSIYDDAFDDDVINKHGPKPVTKIKNGAFWANNDFEYLIISDGITYIGDQAFMASLALQSVVFPSNNFEMGTEVFKDCHLLTNAEITSGMTNINPATYAGNQYLETFTVTDNDAYFVDDDVLYAVNYEGHGKTLLVCPAGKTGSVTVRDDCKYIHGLAFKNTKVSSISISDSVEQIDESFKTCKSLQSFAVAEGNTHYSSISGMLYDRVENCLIAYPRGNAQTSLTMPSTIYHIGEHVFDGVNTLTSLNLYNVTNIGEGAFANMTNLASVSLSHVVEIGDGAFKNDTSLNSVTLNSVLRLIPTEAFMGCTSLSSISLPSTLLTIGQRAFKGCSSLSGVELPEHLENINTEAFRDCTSLDINEIPSTVNSVGRGIFRNTALDNIVLPLFNYIPDEMFMECRNLTSIGIPSYIRTIGYDAFNGCSNLTSVTIVDNSVTTIHSKAFMGTGIQKIFIPESVTVIEASAFKTAVNHLYIFTDISVSEDKEVYSSGTDEGGWLRDGWTAHLGEGFHIYYNQSRADFAAFVPH